MTVLREMTVLLEMAVLLETTVLREMTVCGEVATRCPGGRGATAKQALHSL
jgi:hypothetical protein